ncbi:MAG: LysM peptidoglycan-binding domain-containing protein [Anaerolineae bacterium]
MSKRAILSLGVMVLVVALILVSAGGCTRPKPEAKATPTAVVGEPVLATETPAPVVTQVVSPTVVTTSPTTSAPQPTGAAGEAGTAPTPTPVVIAITPAATPAAPPVVSPPAGGEEWVLYTIQWGDTLYSLAARYGTTVEAIMALNPTLTSPDQIQAGMQVKIPKGAGGTAPVTGEGVEYIVQAGDDLGLIASKFGVTVDDIVRANGLSNPNFIYVGQKLVIPASSGGTVPAPSGGLVHVVRPGETLLMIASMYGTTPEAIAQANGLANPNWIYVGQTLRIP